LRRDTGAAGQALAAHSPERIRHSASLRQAPCRLSLFYKRACLFCTLAYPPHFSGRAARTSGPKISSITGRRLPACGWFALPLSLISIKSGSVKRAPLISRARIPHYNARMARIKRAAKQYQALFVRILALRFLPFAPFYHAGITAIHQRFTSFPRDSSRFTFYSITAASFHCSLPCPFTRHYTTSATLRLAPPVTSNTAGRRHVV